MTPSGLPTLARVGIGAAVELTFITWIVTRGRSAALAGNTGTFAD